MWSSVLLLSMSSHSWAIVLYSGISPRSQQTTWSPPASLVFRDRWGLPEPEGSGSHTRPTESKVTAGAGSGEQSSMVICNWLIIWLWPFKHILNSNRLNSNTWLAKPHFSLGSSSGHSWLSNEDPLVDRSLAKLVTLWQIKFTSAACSQRPPTCLPIMRSWTMTQTARVLIHKNL